MFSFKKKFSINPIGLWSKKIKYEIFLPPPLWPSVVYYKDRTWFFLSLEKVMKFHWSTIFSFALLFLSAFNALANDNDVSDFSWSKVRWLHTDISGWAETSRIDSVRISGRGSVCIEHSKRRVWRGVRERIAGNPWIIVKLRGTYYAGTWEWLRDNQDCKLESYRNGIQDLYSSSEDPVSLPKHIKVEPLHSWVPKGGEVVGFMVSTLARGTLYGPIGANGRERSNVYWYRLPFPDGTGGGSVTGVDTPPSTPKAETGCRPNQREPHWRWVEDQGLCLPSCGAARARFCRQREDKCVGFTLASGRRSCSDEANFDILSVPSYQPCCMRKLKAQVSTSTRETGCRPNQREPHWRWVEDQGLCLPSCGAARARFCRQREDRCVGFTLASGRSCSNGANFDILSVPSYQPCCMRRPKAQASAPTRETGCRSNQREPHWRWVEDRGLCLPSCGAARAGFCRQREDKCVGFTLASGRRSCSDGANFEILAVPSYQEPCCMRKRKRLSFHLDSSGLRGLRLSRWEADSDEGTREEDLAQISRQLEDIFEEIMKTQGTHDRAL